MSTWHMLFETYEEASACLPEFESEHAAKCIEDAEDCIRRERESFDRCDTDGFLSQWCLTIHAEELRREAELASHGGLVIRPVLIDTRTGEVVSPYITIAPSRFRPWEIEYKWRVRRDHPVAKSYGGTEYVTDYKDERKFEALCLKKVWALAPGKMASRGPGDYRPEGKGLSGMASYTGKWPCLDATAAGLGH